MVTKKIHVKQSSDNEKGSYCVAIDRLLRLSSKEQKEDGAVDSDISAKRSRSSTASGLVFSMEPTDIVLATEHFYKVIFDYLQEIFLNTISLEL